MTISEFGAPEITVHGSAVARAGHVVAYIEGEKFRLCFYISDGGTWAWAPGVPSGVTVPQELEGAVTAAVSSALAGNVLASE